MPIRAISSLGDRVVLNIGGISREFLFSSLPPGSRATKGVALKNLVQAFLDVRIPRASLPSDDPDKLADPARPGLFWDGADLVARPVLVVSVVWDGTTYALELEAT